MLTTADRVWDFNIKNPMWSAALRLKVLVFCDNNGHVDATVLSGKKWQNFTCWPKYIVSYSADVVLVLCDNNAGLMGQDTVSAASDCSCSGFRMLCNNCMGILDHVILKPTLSTELGQPSVDYTIIVVNCHDSIIQYYVFFLVSIRWKRANQNSVT